MESWKQHESWKMFDRISSTYDKVNRILSLGMDQRWRQQVARFLPPQKNLRLLDLATGTGDQLISLFERGASIEVAIGLDLSSEMLSIAKKKIEHKPYWNRIEWCRGDAECLPFGEALFDVATFSFGIRNVPNPFLALQEIHRTLKPNGRCLILEFSLPPQPIKSVYLLYLRHLLPRLGGLVSRVPAAYRYLNETIESFPSGPAFCAMFQKAHFRKIAAYPMALGAVTLYVGEK